MKRFLTLLLLTFTLVVSAQSSQLAQQYFRDGEYEKSAELYLQLAEAQPRNAFYFDRYVGSLMKLQRYKDAEAAIKKQLRKDPRRVSLYVKYGQLREEQYDEVGAKRQYERAIEELPADQFTITQLANAFLSSTKYAYAIKTYERGGKLLKDRGLFSYNLGDLYRRKGEYGPMISNYLDALDANPKRERQVRTYFQRYLDKDGLLEAQKQLYARIAEAGDDNVIYPEMLAWVFIQRKDFKSALRQARALDRRFDEDGQRVLAIGEMAANAKDYETAIGAFDYITENKDRASPFYLDAKRQGLVTRRRAITDGYEYTREDLTILEAEYERFLSEFGTNSTTARIAIQLAELEAIYLNDLDKAIAILEEVKEVAGLDERIRARAKIALADYYLMQGEVWESTLLYSQVDKRFKEDLLGHEARFRNARLSYYRGDFEWAQSQFDVLKASTSRLIANDALDLSVFIIDNLGLDTTATALQAYADADLLVFQNKFDEAFTTLDRLVEAFPGHDLEDDVIYLKAEIYRKRRDYGRAAEAYQRVVDDYPESIRVDNALFSLAELYEGPLDDPAKAQELYEKLFIDYSGSILAVGARKKYRELRGDDI